MHHVMVTFSVFCHFLPEYKHIQECAIHLHSEIYNFSHF